MPPGKRGVSPSQAHRPWPTTSSSRRGQPGQPGESGRAIGKQRRERCAPKQVSSDRVEERLEQDDGHFDGPPFEPGVGHREPRPRMGEGLRGGGNRGHAAATARGANTVTNGTSIASVRANAGSHAASITRRSAADASGYMPAARPATRPRRAPRQACRRSPWCRGSRKGTRCRTTPRGPRSAGGTAVHRARGGAPAPRMGPDQSDERHRGSRGDRQHADATHAAGPAVRRRERSSR
jgi:hypothetical protein